MTTPSILPNNRTPLEAAIEANNAARFPLRTDLVASVWSPETCPVELLPYLAWGLSVDLWSDGWSETTKREVCRKSLMFHRRKTTPAGIKEHVAVAGSQVLKIIRPPAREFRRGTMTDEQRRAWLDTLPQIRIYPFATRSTAKARHFFTGPFARHQFHGHGYLRKSRGFDIYGRRATFYDRGAEVPVTLSTSDAGLTERVVLRHKAPNRMFFGGKHFLGHGYIRTSEAANNVITVQFGADAAAFAVNPSMDPVNVLPTRIAQGRIAPRARMFFGRFKGFLKPSNGPLMIYDRIALNDPARTGQRRKVRSFHGHGRYGIDPFTAELKIRVPMKRPRRRSGRWNGTGFRKAADMGPLNRAIEAVRVSKAFRDTVLIDTTTQGLVRFNSGLRFGKFVFGQIKEVE